MLAILIQPLLMLTAGMGLGARMAGASIWWGVLGGVALLAWMVAEAAVDDRERRAKADADRERYR